jgi:hypothetical protein
MLCLRKVEGNVQHLPTAMVLIVGILATVFLCYHFQTEYSIQTPTSAFSAILLIAMQVYNLISQI